MSTTATTSIKSASGRQRQTIADLTRELGYTNVPEPRSNIHASAIIQRLIEDRETQGAKPAPTSRQIRMLERLGLERGKTYKIPATRKAASALIKRLLEAATPAAQDTAAA